jgi:hypothetical protein
MKKHIFLLLTGLSFSFAQSQEIKDAVRYSQDNLTGTARFRAMSGAFGALGGDLSSIGINPAGSAVFVNNQIGFTANSINSKNNSNYFGTNTTENNNSLDLNQAGGVFVFKNQNPKNNWTKIAVGLNFENTNNFDNSTFSAGTNPTRSIADYFLSFANANPTKQQQGIPLGFLKDNDYFSLNYIDQQAYLGYNGFLINPLADTDDNTIYNSNVPAGGNYYQENTIIGTGYNGKLAFNASADYNNKIQVGLNLNSHFTDFKQITKFYEQNDNVNSNPVDLVNTYFENEINTIGSGFSFQLGTIIKATKELRVGLVYDSPTWYTMNDQLRQNLSSETSNGFVSVDSNEFIIYDTYKFRTPSKITGSLAYIFGTNGLLSIDYSRKDYSKAEYSIGRDTRDPFINGDIAQNLNTSNEIRVGGEYRIKALSLRAGYRYEQSPYKNKATMGDLTGYSGGLGYNFGSTKLDLSYAYAKRDSQQDFFSQGFTSGAQINNINNTVALTLLFEL